MTTGLLRYTGRRLLQAIPLLIGIVTLTFLLIHLAPGDPVSTFTNDRVPPEVVEQMRANWGLDQPLPVQYVKWLAASLTGDFGYSFSQSRPVTEVIGSSLPNTLRLGLVSLCVIFVVGCFVGTLQAVRQYDWVDTTLTIAALAIYSMPGFWLGLMLIIAVSSPWWPEALCLPSSGMSSVRVICDSVFARVFGDARHYVLPVIALGLASAAGISRYMRGEMLEVIGQDYIRTARAKGLSERRVIYRHALRNALLPVVSLLGLYLPLLIGGSVVIEVVFSWPGLGRGLYNAVLARDYPVVMAGTFVFGALVIAGNLVADLLYAVVDPRIRYD
ncbi:MAG: ABC transporter permease [Gemmatimonadota bacterium]